MQKRFWPFFCIIENDKGQEANYKGPKDDFDSFCGSDKIGSLRPKRLLKTQIFEQKARKNFGLASPFYRT